MSKLTLGIGVALLVLGIGGYLATGGSSLTALIPAGFGVLYLLLGIVGQRRPGARMHVMHLAALLSLLGIGGNVTAIITVVRMLGGTQPEHPAAAILRTLMAILCAMHLVAAVRSFIAARRKPATPQ